MDDSLCPGEIAMHRPVPVHRGLRGGLDDDELHESAAARSAQAMIGAVFLTDCVAMVTQWSDERTPQRPL